MFSTIFSSPHFLSFNLTSQIHRVWRVQRELLRDESRLHTLCHLQEQSVPIRCPASCEWHKPFLCIPFSLAITSLYCKAFGTSVPTYLRSRSHFSGFLETLAAYWVTKAGFKGGILREKLPLISSIWRFPLWLMCLGWWRSDPKQMAGLSLSLIKPSEHDFPLSRARPASSSLCLMSSSLFVFAQWIMTHRHKCTII